jgi:hypothetical protein
MNRTCQGRPGLAELALRSRALVADEVTARARQLIARHIHSVEQLEVLLLIRAAPDRDWTVKDISRALVSAPETVMVRLSDLEQRGLIARSGEGWRYAAEGELARAVDDVAAAYATRRFTVVELIFSNPSGQAATLADAFRIRKKRDD